MPQHNYLFEISWEVCNKVGGINTVIRTKAKEAVEQFGSQYILIGPWLSHNEEFIEYDDASNNLLTTTLKQKGIPYRYGYWDIDGKPTVILVGYHHRYNVEQLLHQYWLDFGVNSYDSRYDYIEPLLFATASAELIATIAQQATEQKTGIIAHFHEWLCGAGVLYLKKHLPSVSTVFTTHATILGRSLSAHGTNIHQLSQEFTSQQLARQYGIHSKHSLELATAREVDCFTTVSNVTALEAKEILKKYPDIITYNGLNLQDNQMLQMHEKTRQQLHKQIVNTCERLLGKTLPEHTQLWITSGRYETHNKGYDVLLHSLKELAQHLRNSDTPVVVLFLVAQKKVSEKDCLQPTSHSSNNATTIARTHHIDNTHEDEILALINKLKLDASNHFVNIIYSPAYLDGHDGVFNLPYHKMLAAADLSIFPSYYEPWGYTPLESIGYGTPTITTDLSGFGHWMIKQQQQHHNNLAVTILPRKNHSDQKFINILTQCLTEKVNNPDREPLKTRHAAVQLSQLADWSVLYDQYINSYRYALANKKKRLLNDKISSSQHNMRHQDNHPIPFFAVHTLHYQAHLPKPLAALRNIAQNYWWSWHPEAQALFRDIDPVLWEHAKHNPIGFLRYVDHQTLARACENEVIMQAYQTIVRAFHHECFAKDRSTLATSEITDSRPIAYFCMEYGIHESLPIYSGGLGVLAGDYLKAISKLGVPFVAVGLFYKYGYFKQQFSSDTEQLQYQEEFNLHDLPIQKVKNQDNDDLIITLEYFPEKPIYCQVWLVSVGRVKLYLLDTDVAQNALNDRSVTYRLYDTSPGIRIKQEIVLGMGGLKLLHDHLKIQPSAYHINEGHSAFLLLERIKNYITQGYSFTEAHEIVHSSTILTTHTPVAAGNERFTTEEIQYYFATYCQAINISIEQLLALGYVEGDGNHTFNMTAFALRCCSKANAVSLLHGKVARNMWKAIWPNFIEADIPILHITNGVHLLSWLGPNLRALYNQHFNTGWTEALDAAETWQQIDHLEDQQLWHAHEQQKQRLLNSVQERVFNEYVRRNENNQLIDDTIEALCNRQCLVIGFARRFATYKRHGLILQNRERLIRILTKTDQPVILLIAGKAHPSDTLGKESASHILHCIRDKRLNGRVIFLENYDLALGQLLMQGVNVWLNTPIINFEACGTSGMKAAINGAINISTKDGWWYEAYTPDHGFAIDSYCDDINQSKCDRIESLSLLNILEHQALPLFFTRNGTDYSQPWLRLMKSSIKKISLNFNAVKMVKNYFHKLYQPTAAKVNTLLSQESELLKQLVHWKQNIQHLFSNLAIRTIQTKALGNTIKCETLIALGELSPDEIRVEMVLTRKNPQGNYTQPQIIPFICSTESTNTAQLSYSCEYALQNNGTYHYAIRVIPYHPLISSCAEGGKILWEAHL